MTIEGILQAQQFPAVYAIKLIDLGGHLNEGESGFACGANAPEGDLQSRREDSHLAERLQGQ